MTRAIIDRVYLPALKSYYPSGYDEIRGIADGAGVTLEDVVLLNSRYDLARLGDDEMARPPNGRPSRGAGEASDMANECTSAYFSQESTASQDVLVAQNWDMSSRLWDQDCAIYLEVHPEPSENKPSLFMVTEAGQLGRSGMNSAGMGVTANSLMSSEDYIPIPYRDAQGKFHDCEVKPLLPISMLRRMILESNHLAEAMTAACNFPRHVSNNLTIGTAEGFGLCLEVTPKNIYKVYKDTRDRYLVHANHFVHQGFLGRNDLYCRYPGGSSWFRQKRLEDLVHASAQKGAVTPQSIIDALSDHLSFPESLCVHPDGNPVDAVIRHLPGYPFRGITSTIACVVYNLTKKEVRVCSGPPCQGTFQTFHLDGIGGNRVGMSKLQEESERPERP
ncbi:acyl-coenzyme a 6-aminopenicillanic acid acyl-transferase [Purpureocillium lavendulum]|uniref:Acyl-coenzyme a 6-aminopenicillanic acid acyl-transferase n=1 Tax=Purpureocillium lavendulum TaxID=1247861 RepID=A0AB34FMR2_9HYPO|nr:acyl-coenzyme a 6-aminopenicillanic acid acyl-transferase [Purpureocillium lavendulum]